MENAPPSLRGELTRWLIEPKAGVFVGNVSAIVRELLWKKVCIEQFENGAMMIFSTNNEQGYSMLIHGTRRRTIIDIEGVELIKIL